MEATQLQTGPSESSLPDEFFQVANDDLVDLWPVLHQILDPVFAYTHGKVAPGDVLDSAARGESQVWVQYLDGLPAAVVVTAIDVYPTARRVLKVMLAAGRDARRWRPHIQTALESFGRKNQCDSLEIIGRRGWGKLYPDYQEIETVFSKEL